MTGPAGFVWERLRRPRGSAAHAWERLPRPLDPLRSIKVKLGVLVVVTACIAILIVLWGYPLGFRGRETVPVGLLIALVITQLIAHGMTAPLREMTAAARAMARGDYSRRVRSTSRDEVGELARAFNRMAADLAAVDRQRQEFVANVSHELRTPISALHAVLENVADGVTPASPEVLESALEQTERLGRLVGQLLDLSKVDAGAVPLDLRELEVAGFVDEVTAAFPDTPVKADIAPGLCCVADRDRLHQVLANLLDNAVRHGPSDGAVSITARPGDGAGSLVLEVSDEGPGIPKGQRERVFERFSRGASGAATPDGGTGLGLAIARWVVTMHNGRIGVVDTPHGCRIRVTLPARGCAGGGG
ncbi:sensor histidine kinase [Actinomadura rupiterrae]|uniref:sensor histidine kinase n=1 Tax=Actinomadura rupiterrae TaxID=559627 RepID=UPI0020A275DA|nr:ATP-binding protein [Actinomadura rupiterrae]MCP2340257.1 signal transduction histidine kinase [Actinomadura rupiterrae]